MCEFIYIYARTVMHVCVHACVRAYTDHACMCAAYVVLPFWCLALLFHTMTWPWLYSWPKLSDSQKLTTILSGGGTGANSDSADQLTRSGSPARIPGVSQWNFRHCAHTHARAPEDVLSWSSGHESKWIGFVAPLESCQVACKKQSRYARNSGGMQETVTVCHAKKDLVPCAWLVILSEEV